MSVKKMKYDFETSSSRQDSLAKREEELQREVDESLACLSLSLFRPPFTRLFQCPAFLPIALPTWSKSTPTSLTDYWSLGINIITFPTAALPLNESARMRRGRKEGQDHLLFSLLHQVWIISHFHLKSKRRASRHENQGKYSKAFISFPVVYFCEHINRVKTDESYLIMQREEPSDERKTSQERVLMLCQLHLSNAFKSQRHFATHLELTVIFRRAMFFLDYSLVPKTGFQSLVFQD